MNLYIDPALRQVSDSDESTVSSSFIFESLSDSSSSKEEGEQGSGVEEEAEAEWSTDVRAPSQDAFLGNQGPIEIVHRAVVDVESPENYFQLFFSRTSFIKKNR